MKNSNNRTTSFAFTEEFDCWVISAKTKNGTRYWDRKKGWVDRIEEATAYENSKQLDREYNDLKSNNITRPDYAREKTNGKQYIGMHYSSIVELGIISLHRSISTFTTGEESWDTINTVNVPKPAPVQCDVKSFDDIMKGFIGNETGEQN